MSRPYRPAGIANRTSKGSVADELAAIEVETLRESHYPIETDGARSLAEWVRTVATHRAAAKNVQRASTIGDRASACEIQRSAVARTERAGIREVGGVRTLCANSKRGV